MAVYMVPVPEEKLEAVYRVLAAPARSPSHDGEAPPADARDDEADGEPPAANARDDEADDAFPANTPNYYPLEHWEEDQIRACLRDSSDTLRAFLLVLASHPGRIMRVDEICNEMHAANPDAPRETSMTMRQKLGGFWRRVRSNRYGKHATAFVDTRWVGGAVEYRMRHREAQLMFDIIGSFKRYAA